MNSTIDKKIVLVGGGGHCKAVIDVIVKEGVFKIEGILDPEKKVNEKILGYPILGSDEKIPNLAQKGYYFLVTIGQIKTPQIRMDLFNYIKKHTDKIATVISPLAYVSPFANIAEGTIVMHHAVVNISASIGQNCIINTKALIEHDACIEEHCHISTGAIINGGSRVKKGTFFGSGAVSKEYVETKEFDFIKAKTLFKGYNNE